MRNELTIAFTTIDRNQQCKQAVEYLRTVFPSQQIVVADQNTPCSEMKSFYTAHGVKAVYVGTDVGLSAARNRMANIVETKYLLLCDDDIAELAPDEVERSVDFMSRTANILAVGGRAEKLIPNDDNFTRRINPDFDYFILREKGDNYATFQSVHKFGFESSTRLEDGFFLADVVENFVIFDMDIFRSLNLSWDERIKIKNEHLDFYLSLKNHADADRYKVVYNPHLIATEIDGISSQTNNSDYKIKRTRNDYTSIYCDKWGLSQEFHVGKWINLFNGHRYVNIPWQKRREFSENEMVKYQDEAIKTRQDYVDYKIDQTNITFLATTMARYEVAESFVLSVRRFFPDSPIVLGIQSEVLADDIEYLASKYSVVIVQLAEDLGLSKARNKLVKDVQSDYFVLCDDDFIIDEKFFINNAYRVLQENPDVGIVGGYYRDVIYDKDLNYKSSMDRQFTMKFEYEKNTKTLLRIPFNYIAHDTLFDDELRCVPVDCVNNLALFRRSIFDIESVRWDDRMKISGEHIDFYFNLYQSRNVKVVYDPSFSVLHNRRQNTGYMKYRNRRSGIQLFYDKWEIENEIDFDFGVKRIVNSIDRWADFE